MTLPGPKHELLPSLLPEAQLSEKSSSRFSGGPPFRVCDDTGSPESRDSRGTSGGTVSGLIGSVERRAHFLATLRNHLIGSELPQVGGRLAKGTVHLPTRTPFQSNALPLKKLHSMERWLSG